MMKISKKDVFLSSIVSLVCIFFSFVIVSLVYNSLFEEFKGIISLVLFFGGYIFLTFIILLGIRRRFPFQNGRFELNDSVMSSVWKLCGYLYIFNLGILINAGLTPVNMRSFVFKMLGAKIGRSVMIGGKILDPTLVEIGDYTMLGEDSLLTAHTVEGGEVELGCIVIGSNVTIGVKAVVLPNVYIGDGAIVAAGAVVTKGARIGAGEIWGGIPARKIGVISKKG